MCSSHWKHLPSMFIIEADYQTPLRVLGRLPVRFVAHPFLAVLIQCAWTSTFCVKPSGVSVPCTKSYAYIGLVHTVMSYMQSTRVLCSHCQQDNSGITKYSSSPHIIYVLLLLVYYVLSTGSIWLSNLSGVQAVFGGFDRTPEHTMIIGTDEKRNENGGRTRW